MGSGVEIIEANGGITDSYTYTKYIWENDPMIRATWGAYTGDSKVESFEDFNNWLIENMPEQQARKDQLVEGKCIDQKLHPLDMIQHCNKTSDCTDAWGHFNGGCCGRIELTKGKADDETMALFNEQGDGGYCTTKMQADYVEARKDGVNLMDYSQYNFENDIISRSTWVYDYPMEVQESLKWDQVLADVRAVYPDFD